jgi:hypothetical protein
MLLQRATASNARSWRNEGEAGRVRMGWPGLLF